MDAIGLIIFLLIGAAAGWIAGKLMRGGGFGVIGNIVVGVIGAFLGSWLLAKLGMPVIASREIGLLITATIGAVVLLFLVGLLKRA
ncbi:MAG: hypothetical protein JMDDDDMK_00467 [Acidobacteria bacterium]|nr:hypothetical protein [Acidobacteriota bacterium]